MVPVVALLVLVAFGRLLASERVPRLDPVRSRWRRLRPHVIAYVRAAPGTYTYLFVLLITTWVLQTSSGTVAHQLLLERSTNLHQLSHDPVRVLFASAFWVSGAWELLGWVVLFTLLVAPVEHWIGTARTAVVFFLGHVGATLLTAAGLWAALRADLVAASVTRAADVGASYGFFAVAGVLTYRLPGRWRCAYAAALAVYAAGAVALDPSFTGFGHLLALAIGLACYPLTRRPRDHAV
jgi:Rhomboid-like protein